MSKQQYGVLLAVALVSGLLSGVVSSYFMVGWLIAAQKSPPQVVEQPPHTAKVIQAARFEVVDESGRIYTRLGMVDGEPGLTLADPAEHTRVSLTVESTGAPRLRYYDSDRRSQLELALFDDGSPLLDFSGEDGALLMGYTGLQINRVGYGKVRLGVEGEIPWSQLSGDKAGKLHVGVEQNIGVHLEMIDADDHFRAVLGQTSLHYPSTGAVEKRAISSLMLFDKDGKVLWQAP